LSSLICGVGAGGGKGGKVAKSSGGGEAGAGGADSTAGIGGGGVTGGGFCSGAGADSIVWTLSFSDGCGDTTCTSATRDGSSATFGLGFSSFLGSSFLVLSSLLSSGGLGGASPISFMLPWLSM
jgi:hypothetical protein